MNKYIYRIQLTRPAMLTEGATPEKQAVMSAHAEHLDHLAQQGVAWLVGRTLVSTEAALGITISRSLSPHPAVRRILTDQPAWRAAVGQPRVSSSRDGEKKWGIWRSPTQQGWLCEGAAQATVRGVGRAAFSLASAAAATTAPRQAG